MNDTTNLRDQRNALRSRRALVLGATGGIGGELARGLLARGWQVRALHRGATHPAHWARAIEWRRGDAMNAADVAAAAEGVELVVHAVNPPGYRRWAELVLPMVDNSIAAAERVGARILLPGTVYNYAPDDFGGSAIAEDAPQRASTRKGAIRVEMEARLAAAAARGVPVLILRAGDYFGVGTPNSWFASTLVKPGRPVGSIIYPGARGVGHQWAYLPDVAETAMRLLDRSEALPTFARFHLDGHWDADGSAMLDAIQRVVGQRSVFRLPWSLVRATAPVVPLCRELSEMRYLWRQPLRLSNAALVAELGAEPHTPLDEAVRATLVGLGCVPAAAMLAQRSDATV